MPRHSGLLALLAAAAAALAVLAVPADAAAPSATGLPAVTGTARVGQALSSTTGLFAGTAPVTYVRAWQRCDAGGAGCVPIVGASAATYALTAADAGGTIRVAVTATNLEGSGVATSAATPIIAPLAPPVNDPGGLPVISGTVRDGQILTTTDGAWSGTAPLTFTRLWQRCDGAGAACAPLASAATRTLTSADVGATIRVEVAARSADGQGIATSAQTAVVDSAGPAIGAVPAVTGTARSGQTLTSATTGAWTGTVPMTFARQWTRCDAGGGACVPIAGATGTAHLLTDADVGQTIRVAVTATNVKSAATASSVASATVGPKVAPQKTTDPSISGTPIDGQLLTASDGAWSGTATITTTRRWQRCAPLGACTDLVPTGTTLTLTSADVGFQIRAAVTATNPDGIAPALSPLTAVVAPAVPSVIAAPAVSGTAREGQVLTATQGTWKGTPTIAYATEWQRCAAGSGCAAIAGASAATYRAVAADVGAMLRALLTATNDGGSTTAASAPTATVTGGVPVSLGLPAISAPLPRDGELYGSTTGTWSGSAPLVDGLQWLRCNATGASCTPISGEIASTYRVGTTDIGRTLRLEVTATNAFGATKAQSAQSPVILAAPPTADANPALAGTLRDGQTLIAAGTWSGTAPIALTYQWQRCDAVLLTCADIAGAAAVTYGLTSPDVGSRMRVRVGALNAGGGGVATSDLATAGDPAGLVAPDAPHATAPALLTGTPVEGATLTSTDATFAGTLPITRTIRWQRCDATGAPCADIAGATGPDRILTAADRGATLRTIVTAINPQGSDSIASAVSTVVGLAVPRNVVAPSVAPDTGLRDGATLTSTDGGWAGSAPMTLAHQWQRCTSATACADVAGARGATFMLTTADVGFALRTVVTASNGAGSTSQDSPPTGVVGTNPPVSLVAPTVAGTPRDGAALTAVDGLWAGPIVFQTTYEWWRCDALGANCSLIPGASAASFLLGPADVGLALRARVVRTSPGGTTAAFTAATAAVLGAPPVSLGAPRVTGGAGVGRTLTADPGAWGGTPALTFDHQWRRCAVDGSACADVGGETGSTYLVTGDDAHTSLRVVVTASNAVGAVSATSASSAEVQTDPPSMLAPPRAVAPAGPLAVSVTLTADPGTWTGALPITYEVQWTRCDAAPAGCAPIAGATAATYLLVTADAGRRIAMTVTASNVVAATTALSDATTTVLPEPPSNTTPPAVTAPAGTREGARLVATAGIWSGATPLTYAVSWLRCSSDGSGCTTVAGAVGTSYTLAAADVGGRMRARVTAANVTADSAVDSSLTAVVTAAPVAAPPPPPAAPKPATPTTATPATTTAAKPATTTPATTTATTTTSTTTPKSKTTSKATAPRSGTSASKSTTTSQAKGPAPVAAIKRVRLTPGGVLLVTLRCPAYRKRSCGATGTVVAGTSLGEVVPDTPLRFTIRPRSVPVGRSVTRAFKLTAPQLPALKEHAAIDFQVRLATPARPTRVSEVFVHTVVPVRLRAA